MSEVTAAQLEIKFNVKSMKNSVILKMLAQKIKPKLDTIAYKLSEEIKTQFKHLIFTHPVITAIMNDRLGGEVGVDYAESRMDYIIHVWTNGLKLTTKSVTTGHNELRGGFTLQMVRSNYDEVLTIRDAIIKERTVRPLPWLQWLLTEGDRAVVQNYDFVLQHGTGRTGWGHMRKNWNRKQWSVPTNAAGTSDNNFVTDVISVLHKDLYKMIKQEFKRVF